MSSWGQHRRAFPRLGPSRRCRRRISQSPARWRRRNGGEEQESPERGEDALQQLLRGLLPTGHYQHIVQGVLFEISRRGVTLSPTPETVRIMAQITQPLQNDAMKPDKTHKLAGRLSFLTQAVFGGVGKAPIKAVCARAADTATLQGRPVRRAPGGAALTALPREDPPDDPPPLHPLPPRRHGLGGAVRGRLLLGPRAAAQGRPRSGDSVGGRPQPCQ